jgi:hypothetical protein
MYQAVEQRPLRLGFGSSIADYDQDAGKILRWSRERPSFSMRPFTSA